VLGLNLLNFWLRWSTGNPAAFQALDVLTMLGFVILIVHQSLNHMREDGMNPRDAILESTRTRLRPIFMTMVTTVLGLFPLVLFPGAGSELYRGLGAVLLGGLVVSTIFTLLSIPALFSLTLDAKLWLVRMLWGQPVAAPRTQVKPPTAVPAPVALRTEQAGR
jgi:HAE1 family hydrophobic/amphiphilic exporter-1